MGRPVGQTRWPVGLAGAGSRMPSKSAEIIIFEIVDIQLVFLQSAGGWFLHPAARWAVRARVGGARQGGRCAPGWTVRARVDGARQGGG